MVEVEVVNMAGRLSRPPLLVNLGPEPLKSAGSSLPEDTPLQRRGQFCLHVGNF